MAKNWDEMTDEEKTNDIYDGVAIDGSPQIHARRLLWRRGIEWHHLNDLVQELDYFRSTNDPPSTGDAIELMYDARVRCDELLIECFSWCGSPIEQLFLSTVAVLGRLSWDIDTKNKSVGLIHVGRHGESGKFATLYLQRQCGNHRVDFALEMGETKLAIELDGHDFHEKTKAQAQHDKSRDRALLATGIPVIRFTGSEVWRDPAKCVDEAIALFVTQRPDTE